jgi:TonB family protein
VAAVASWLGAFWIGMAVHLWQSALFVAILGLVGLALRGASARASNLLYWTGILKLLLPLPLFGPLSRGLLAVGSDAPSAGADSAWGVVRLAMDPVALGAEPAGAALPPSAWLVLTVLWLAGAGWLLPRRPARGGTAASQRLDDGLSGLVMQVGLRPDQVRVSPDVPGPCARGWLRPVVLLPEIVVRGLDADELHATLVHEREHVRRRDPLRYGVLAAVRAALWFYPPVWWLARRIRETTEMACDEAVVRAGMPAAIYCRALARTLKLGLDHGGTPSPVGVLGHRVSFLCRRLERIRSGRRFESMLSHRLIVAAAGLVAVVASLLPVAPVPAILAGDPTLDASLDGLSEGDLPVVLNFVDVPASRVFDALTTTTGVAFRLDPALADRTVTVETGTTSLREALLRIGATAGVRYRVLEPHTVEVYPVLLVGIDGVTSPVRLSHVPPEYPTEAREERLAGRVILQALIDRAGNIGEVEVLHTIPADYEPFARAARDAVRQWRYEPAMRDGEPVDVYFTILVEFTMGDRPAERDEIH